MGELTYRVPPLSLPERNHFATSESLRQYESARLFIERAQLHNSFALDNRSALPLAQLCHRLDGIPLAIELAAPWVRSISLEEIGTFFLTAVPGRRGAGIGRRCRASRRCVL